MGRLDFRFTGYHRNSLTATVFPKEFGHVSGFIFFSGVTCSCP